MIFQTVGNKGNPAVLFFHAMGVTGESSRPVAEYLKAYPHGHFPVFQGFNHMQYQIKDPKGFCGNAGYDRNKGRTAGASFFI